MKRILILLLILNSILLSAQEITNYGHPINLKTELYVRDTTISDLIANRIATITGDTITHAITSDTVEFAHDADSAKAGFNIIGNLITTGTVDIQGVLSNSIGNFNIDDAMDVNSINVTGAIDSKGYIINTVGVIDLHDAVYIHSDLEINGSIYKSLTPVKINDDLDVIGNCDFQGDIGNSLSTLKIIDDVDLTGQLYVSSSLQCNSLTALSGIDVNGGISNVSGGDLVLSDDISITGRLSVIGNLQGTAGTLTINNNAIIVGTSDLQGNISNSTGAVTIDDNLIVTGTISATGTVTTYVHGASDNTTNTIPLTSGVWADLTNGTKDLFNEQVSNGLSIVADSVIFSTAGDYKVEVVLRSRSATATAFGSYFRILKNNTTETGIKYLLTIEESTTRTTQVLTWVISVSASDNIKLQVQNYVTGDDLNVGQASLFIEKL